MLQTGAKHYDMRVGCVRTPIVESDPRPEHLGPNFYHKQEDDLHSYCKAPRKTSWNVIRPAIVIGASDSSSTNGFQSFAFYAAAQARKGLPIEFGGDFGTWQY